ncbi:protein NRT1/ PTR FAMILY 5.2 isoform X2 [Vigna radiata var. radiata]|uniref:Protein NRT1/ PTR FAMILY 5.2 isoform X2 n=1 Tax=Vigna radiata var. radiata TaxID=3916 RepID=A0A3Q0FE71_VIGRR|nr:protein NRT1/ PTR FAMILY 5.2 isoform X2 [Vigna radiata var. radiata]
MERGRRMNYYAEDGTVDLKGKPVLKAKTGGWKACSFLLVYEVFERMTYYGISSNLVLYLTRKLHQGTVTASDNVNNWVGTIYITPILGAYVADAHLGRYWTFVISSVIYLLGMCLLTLSVSLPSLKPPECHEMDVTKCKKATTLQLVLVYIQDNVGWALGYGIPTIGLAIAFITFLAGTPLYRHRLASGSSFTRIARVIVAAVRKRNVNATIDSAQLHELDVEEYTNKGKFRIESTDTLRFLNKACVRTSSSTSEWMLCTVTQVEETKQILRMIPIWVATFIPSTMLAQTNTLFVKQGVTLDRHIGRFNIPPASLIAFTSFTMLVCVVLYDRIFVKIMKRFTKNPRGITLLQRMGIGIMIHIVTMIVASLTERYRLKVAKEHGVVQNGGQVPLSIFILAPQFVLMGLGEAFLEVSKIEFFYDQAPESMKSLGTSYSITTVGIGSFISSFLLSTVSRITKKNGHKGWILNNLNASHLDYYYAFFSVLNFLNFIFFMFATKYFVYRAEISDSIDVLAQELKEKRSNVSN